MSEGTWNDGARTGQPFGATGGGISDLVDTVLWQSDAHVPASVNAGHRGTGIPDVSGNANPSSGHVLWIYGKSTNNIIVNSNPFGAVGGTSAVAPLYAAMVGLMDASLWRRVERIAVNTTTSDFGQILSEPFYVPLLAL